MRGLFFLFLISFFYIGYPQDSTGLLQKRFIKVTDSIQLDSLSIQKFGFKLVDNTLKPIDSTLYQIDFAKAKLYLKNTESLSDSIQVTYFRYPDFITKKYQNLDPSLIIPKNTLSKKLYQLKQPNYKSSFELFNGLSTNGSISRGITVGNNQNSVFNSELDLQISGQLSEGITLKASLQDSNIPLQEGGYSQSIDEFDQIFIELTGKKWGIRAGDIQLSNTKSVFATFTKKLQGLSVQSTFSGAHTETNAYLSGALVRGQYNRSSIDGEEGNQGPYKLIGQGGELFVLIVSGSERVYVNGLLLKRGENNDYIIDYNAGELRFNPTYPITTDMRIIVEYQTSQRNYARIFGLGGAKLSSKKLNLEAFVYSENDLKNQTLQQDLSNEQKRVLSEAGDDENLMTAPSAVPDTFGENKILYRNTGTETNPVYEFLADINTLANPNEPLFQVRFSRVAQGSGNYRLINTTVANRIFEYIAPDNGVPQGDFAPITQLQAPNKLQVGVLMGTYIPNKKTTLDFELAASSNDQNLFSSINDNNNNGGAARFKLEQRLFGKDTIGWSATATGSADWVQKNYRSIERLYNIEFNRDWNLTPGINDQLLTNMGLHFKHPKNGTINYDFQYLDFGNQYTGNRHLLSTLLRLKNWQLTHRSSTLKSTSTALKSTFLRSYTGINYNKQKFWTGAKWGLENNQESEKATNRLTNQSQRYQSYEVFTGVGDSTKVFAKIGYRYRVNDSIQNNQLQRVSTANTAYLNSQLISNSTTRLSLFVNYRVQNDVRETEKDKNLNSRLLFRQKLWRNRILWNTAIETQSGTLPRQDFTYVEVEPGRGLYTWNDYNNDGKQDLLEFELSPFPDQATYIRVLLPRQVFLKTYQNKLSQQVTLDLANWKKSELSWKRFAAHFYNQTSFIIDRKVSREGNDLNFNIFKNSADDLGLNANLRNSLFFNRGKQHYTSNYTFLNATTNNILITGSQSNETTSHNFNFSHKIKESWLFDSRYIMSHQKSEVENTPDRNFTLEGNEFTPKVSYLFSGQSSVSVSYSFLTKENTALGAEKLNQQKLTAAFRLGNQENATVTGAFDWFENEFEGNSFSPVAYQLLNGLQPGTNFTWNLLAQKKITKFLELNLNYSGRKTKISKTIHSGSVQLRAFF
ncbi:hypothetical protein [Aquimarina agarilytica]|uniref:hypothetical protein n=1 Tax=Aquimarina agarilytica TaxID=1087449 RepID=UPI0002897D85|nr:hypothetical protein [Aquimarina agarilytica]